MNELKPCPFCGNIDTTHYESEYGCPTQKAYYISCMSCRYSIESGSSYHDADRKWNTRPIEDALRARVVELEELLAHCEEKKESIAWINFNTIERKIKRIEELEEKLERIKTWCNAYPVDIFPEPDFKLVQKALKEHGITLDAVCASNFRFVLKGIKDIVDDTN